MPSPQENRPVGISDPRRREAQRLLQLARIPTRRIARFFFVVGFVPLGMAGYWAQDQIRVLRSWPEVPATVTSSGVKEVPATPGPDGSVATYSVVVGFRYQVAGKQYQRNVESPWSTSIFSTMQKKAELYSRGSEHLIRCNPADPTEVRFDVGYNLETFFPSLIAGVLGLATVLISLFVMFPKIGG